MIEICALTKRFGSKLAVDGLSFSIGPGTVAGFLGPNGAGKTTTLRMLLGLITPTSGTATINGVPYRRLPEPARAVGAVLDSSGFHGGRTARDHLRILAAAGRIRPTRIGEVLVIAGLDRDADRRVGGYSLGMRQRLGLAAALLGDPEILILDEPANGLDPEGVRWLRTLLREFADRGRTVLVSSHLLAEVAQTVDSVVIIGSGRLVRQATLAELTAQAQPRLQVTTPAARQLADALVQDGARAEVVATDRLQVTGATPELVRDRADQLGVTILSTTTETADLEDAFFQLTSSVQAQEPQS
jgi:ABC-2 type transport system ATP-binding protein